MGTSKVFSFLYIEPTVDMVLIVLDPGFMLVLNCRRVTSDVYSISEENRSWKYSVVDVHVFICGASWMLDSVKDALEGAEGLLEGLQFGSKERHDWDDTGLSILSPIPPVSSCLPILVKSTLTHLNHNHLHH